jgi:3-methyladenine DNA glycosylase AlkC
VAIFDGFQKFQKLMEAVDEKFPKQVSIPYHIISYHIISYSRGITDINLSMVQDGDKVPYNRLSLADALEDVYRSSPHLECKTSQEKVPFSFLLLTSSLP